MQPNETLESKYEEALKDGATDALLPYLRGYPAYAAEMGTAESVAKGLKALDLLYASGEDDVRDLLVSLDELRKSVSAEAWNAALEECIHDLDEEWQSMIDDNYTENYSPDQPRDDHGRFSGGGGESSELLQSIKANGGFTYQPVNHRTPKSGYAVATFDHAEKVFDAKDLKVRDVFNYLKSHREAFADSRVHVGGWVDKSKVYLDLSTVVKSRDEAIKLGVAHNQLAVFDLGKFKTVEVPSERTHASKV